MQNIKNALYRFLQGRYGNDSLSRFILVVSIVLMALNLLFIGNAYATIVVYFFLLLVLFRTYSKKISKRRSENAFFLHKTKSIRRLFTINKKRVQDRNNHYYTCPNCKQMVRVPKGKGVIVITCPKCKETFEKKS